MKFPLTRISAIHALRDGDEQQRKVAFGKIVAAYWAPVYKYLRMQWNKDPDSAADLTQGFFLHAFEKDFLAEFDSSKARFRTYLRLCLDRYANKQDIAESRIKRGGDSEHLSLDFASVESEIRHDSNEHTLSPEQVFEKEWTRNLFAGAVAELRTQCESSGKKLHFEVFECYDLQALDSSDRISYQHLAERHSITVETVTNYLAAMRREFRKIVLDKIRELTASEEEYRQEVRGILGVDK